MIRVLDSERLSSVEVEAFLQVSESVAFASESRAEIYRWCASPLCYEEYGRLAAISNDHLYNLLIEQTRAGRDTPATTAWSRPKMAQLSANTSVSAISLLHT